MTREEAAEMLEYIRYCNDYKKCRESIAIDMAIEALRQGDWIPCSSGELPKLGEHVIGTVENDNGNRVVTPCIYMPQMLSKPWPLIAWRPLPEPYKGVE